MSNREDLEIKIETQDKKVHNSKIKNNVDYFSFQLTNNSNENKDIKLIGIFDKEIDKSILDKNDIEDLFKRNNVFKIDDNIKVSKNSKKNTKKISINKLLKILTSKNKNYYAFFCELNDDHTYNLISYRFIIDNKKNI